MKPIIATALAFSLLLPAAACNRRKAPLTPAPPDWLESAVEEQAQRGAPGTVRVGELYKGVAFHGGDRQQWHVTLEGGGCIYLSAAGDQTVEEINLYLWGPTGKRLETVRGDQPREMLRYCPPAGARGEYKFEAKVTDGHGHFAVGLYAQGNPDAPPAEGPPASGEGPSQPSQPAQPSQPRADLSKRVDTLAKTNARGAALVGEPFHGTADSTDWYVALETGKCYWFVGAGDAHIDKLSLYLWDPDDNRVKASKAESNEVTVGHCPTRPGMYHVRAQVASGEGAYQVGLYAKHK